MRILAFLLMLVITPLSAKADTTDISTLPSGFYKMDPTHASLTWKVNHMGLSNYTARFTKFDIDLMVDTQDITKSQVKATIDPTSIRTDYPNAAEKDFDKKLSQDSGWFNAEQYPEITFSSATIEKTGDNTGTLTGDLTFLGVTKPVTMDVTLNGVLGNHPFANKPAIGFSASGSIKRSDFGMGTYIPTVGDEVSFVIEAEFIYAN